MIKTFDGGLCLLEQYCLAHFLSEIYRQLACVKRGKETFEGVEITLGIDRKSNAYQIFATCYCFESMKSIGKPALYYFHEVKHIIATVFTYKLD